MGKRLFIAGLAGAVVSALLFPSVAYAAENPSEQAAKAVKAATPDELPAPETDAQVLRDEITLSSDTSGESLSIPLR